MFIAPPAVRAVITDFIFTGLAFIFVLLRLGTRAFMIKSVGAEDYLILGAMVSSYRYVFCHFARGETYPPFFTNPRIWRTRSSEYDAAHLDLWWG